jgi:hypothetical protein
MTVDETFKGVNRTWQETSVIVVTNAVANCLAAVHHSPGSIYRTVNGHQFGNEKHVTISSPKLRVFMTFRDEYNMEKQSRQRV